MKLKDFFAEYQSKRQTCLTEDQFSSVLMMLPAALVASADARLTHQNLKGLIYWYQRHVGICLIPFF